MEYKDTMLNRVARMNDLSEMKEELSYIRSTGYTGEHDVIYYDYVFKWTKMYKCCKDFGLLEKGKTVIDIGGGMSPVQYFLSNHGCKVYNLDINFTDSWFPTIHNKYYTRSSPEFIAESEKNAGNITQVHGDALTSLKSFPSNSIDAVVDLCALHIFLKDGSIMNEISRVLKPKGFMISIGDIANPHLGRCDDEFLYPNDMAKTLSTNENLQLLEPYDYDTWEEELQNYEHLIPRRNVDYSDLSLMNMKNDPSSIPYKNIPKYPIYIWTGIFVLQKKND